MADQGRSDFCAHEPCALQWIETNVNKFATSNHTALKLDAHSLRSHLSLICDYELYILPNKKLVSQRIMVKTTWRTDHTWSAIFGVMVCCSIYESIILRPKHYNWLTDSLESLIITPRIKEVSQMSMYTDWLSSECLDIYRVCKRKVYTFNKPLKSDHCNNLKDLTWIRQ